MNIKSRFACSVVCLFAFITVDNLRAETGDDNPTGPAGIFYGNITTGRSYDPYTRNARTEVTDIVIAGAVGTRPLAFTRVANSRGSAGFHPFAYAGGWQHSYGWYLSDEPFYFSDPNALPTAYNVDFPDGREIRFTSAAGTPAGNAGETNFRGPIGLSQRLTPLAVANGSAFLILTDGSKVKFQATVQYNGSSYYRTYKAVEIIDPFGLVTALSYNADGTLDKVTEPAGRWLQLAYIDFQNGSLFDHVIDHVTASDGRQVQYSYEAASFSEGAPSYTYLSSVAYYSDSTIAATYYIYKAPNVPDFTGNFGGPPSLAYCSDAMFDGPMKQIAYDYLHYNVDQYAVYGELLSEKRGIATDPVSTIEKGGNGIDITRTETRGDGPSRTFTYRTWPYLGHMLFNYTGFNGENAGALGYDGSNYLSYFTDANSNATSMIREVISGRITQLTHPPDKNDVQSSILYDYGNDATNPYYIEQKTDELGNTISYERDGLHRIIQIDYPDGGYETFTYNSFNQVLTHRLTSGGEEVSTYDGRGLKTSFENADGKIYNYGYDALDRLSSVIDPEGFETNFEYNTRGQLTKTIYPPDPTTGIRYTKINGYNGYGTLTSVTDELGHSVVFTVDDYQRLVDRQDQLLKHTTYSYLPWGQTSSYLTTANFVYSTTSRSGMQTDRYADNEFRLLHSVVAPGTTEQADTYFTYDPVGNRIEMQDPNGNNTSYEYDKRNRKIGATDALMQGTAWDYDQASNLIKETRPDLKYRTWDLFDPMNRAKQTTDFLGNQTSYEYDLAGNLTQMTDSKGAIYSFSYDPMNRKNGATYPADATGQVKSESWTYDDNGNIAVYTNPAGKRQTFTYDNRNRQVHSSWSVPGPNVTTAYDGANRVTSISTADGTTVAFGYDNANRQIWEDQTLDGQPTRHVQTDLAADGRRASLDLDSVLAMDYFYSARRQVSQIKNGGQPWITYAYDLDGHVLQRQDVKQGLDSTHFSYDALNRVTLCTQTGQDDVAFATSHYDYDLNGNIQDTYRDEQAGKGERFGYDDANRLISAVYNADDVQTPNPTNYDRSVNYTLGPLNRLSMDDDGTVTDYTPNGLNQYVSVTGQQSLYDQNFSHRKIGGWNYQFDASRRLLVASQPSTEQSVEFTYDGLNRCVKRVVNGVTTIFTYDGWKPIAEWDENGNLKAWNLYGPGPDEILVRYSPSTGYLHYHSDQFGNVKFLLNRVNTVIENYTYDAFGAPKITDAGGTELTESAYGNRFMFTGREYLAAIGIYDYRNRMYSPLIGRFLQVDPLGFPAGDNNIYRYAGHNPVNAADPTGTVAEPIEDGFRYVAYGGSRYVGSLLGGHVAEGNTWLQCAGAARYLGGGYGADGNYHNMPIVEHWQQGAPLSSTTSLGTVIVTGWGPDGGYPNHGVEWYNTHGGTTNHTAIVGYSDSKGNIITYSQSPNGALVAGPQISPDEFSQWNEVFVPEALGPYEIDESSRVVVVGQDPNTGENIYAGRPVIPASHSSAGGFSWGGGGGWGGGGQGVGYGAFGGVGGIAGAPGPGSITGSLIGDCIAHNSG